MDSDEEEEALNTLKIMPNGSVESIISAAEKIGIHSPPQSPLHIQVINNNINIIIFIYITRLLKY